MKILIISIKLTNKKGYNTEYLPANSVYQSDSIKARVLATSSGCLGEYKWANGAPCSAGAPVCWHIVK